MTKDLQEAFKLQQQIVELSKQYKEVFERLEDNIINVKEKTKVGGVLVSIFSPDNNLGFEMVSGHKVFTEGMKNGLGAA